MLKTLPRSRQTGATLVELMISVSLGMLLLAGLISFVIASLNSNASIAKATRFNGEMRSVMTLMANDIRRSGGWGNAISGLGAAAANPFSTVTTPTTSCILYSYDMNENGTLESTVTMDERFGFLLHGGAVKMRNGVAGYNCTDSASWAGVTDPKTVRVTDLNFSLSTINAPTVGGHSVSIREVTITLTAELVNDPSVNQTLTQSVRIPNDAYL